MRLRWVLVGVAALALAACGDDGGSNSGDDAPGDAGGDDGGDGGDGGMFVPPTTLAETGLCADAACTTINDGIIEYAPQYQLYSDGAEKRRWLYLPPGTTIDTSDMNHWKFPVGTKLWKEFTSNGTRVETRLIQKVGADDSLQASFFMGSYVWNAGQDATELADPINGVADANGTMHDVPTRQQCRSCHNGVPGRVLGVNAMSLDFDSPTVDLADLVSMNLLSAPPQANGSSFYPLPGTDTDKAAFGYLHANCGHCHNPESPTYTVLTSNMSLRLEVEDAKRDTVADVPAHATTVNKPFSVGMFPDGALIVDPVTPASSVLLLRMNADGASNIRMPQIGIEINDSDGIAAVTAWIDAIQ